MAALCDGRDNNPSHKEIFNKFISELKKKNPKWDKITIGCEHSTARTLFQEAYSGYDTTIQEHLSSYRFSKQIPATLK